MLEQVLKTVDLLANVANAEATPFNAKKDKANQDKAKALYTKQHQFAALGTHLRTLTDDFRAIPVSGQRHTDAIGNAAGELLRTINIALTPLHGLTHPNKKLSDAVNDPRATHLVSMATHFVQGLKRNLELRKMMLENLDKERAEIKDEQSQQAFEEKLKAYTQLCEEDNQLAQALRQNQSAAVAAIGESNKKWAKLLNTNFNVKNLAENKQEHVPTNPAAQLVRNVFDSVAKAFDPKTTDRQEAFMGIIGSLLKMFVGIFANLFKPLLGGGTDAAEKVESVSNNVSDYFMKMMKDGQAASAKQPQPTSAKTMTPLAKSKASATTKEEFGLLPGVADVVSELLSDLSKKPGKK